MGSERNDNGGDCITFWAFSASLSLQTIRIDPRPLIVGVVPQKWHWERLSSLILYSLSVSFHQRHTRIRLSVSLSVTLYNGRN